MKTLRMLLVLIWRKSKISWVLILIELMREMSFHVSRKGYSKLKSYLQKFSNEEQQGTKNTWVTIENKLN